jgi:hypothetical protein
MKDCVPVHGHLAGREHLPLNLKAFGRKGDRMKKFLSIILCFAIIAIVPAKVMADCCEDAKACEELLDEAAADLDECNSHLVDCDDVASKCIKDLEICEQDCKRCSWREIVLDKKIQSAVIGVSLAIVGGILTLVAAP